MKRIALIALALLITVSAMAQETGYLPGAIITAENERIEGLVKNVNLIPAHILENIKFKTGEGEKAKSYSPTEILGYEQDGNFFVSKKTSTGTTLFVKKFNTGRLRLYGELAFDGSASYRVIHVPYIQIEGDPVIRLVQKVSFRKQLLDYLKDAPSVCELIKNKSLKWKNIAEIVNRYNAEVQGGK